MKLAKEQAIDSLQDDSKEIRVSMFIKSAVLEKIKAIAALENTLPKEEIHQALLDKIETYEKKNGLINTSEHKNQTKVFKVNKQH